MYTLQVRSELDRLFTKLSKKNRQQYEIILKKVEEILQNPQHYKNLRSPLQHLKRVHIDKHFVLTFSLNEHNKTVTLEDFDHHGNIYRN